MRNGHLGEMRCKKRSIIVALLFWGRYGASLVRAVNVLCSAEVVTGADAIGGKRSVPDSLGNSMLRDVWSVGRGVRRGSRGQPYERNER